jgi:hypothetical protein
MFWLFLKVNIQAEYQQTSSTNNNNGTIMEDEDSVPAEPPARRDYGKKVLVNNYKMRIY